MKPLRIVLTTSCVAGLFGIATPALAQHHGGGHAGGARAGAAINRGGGGHAMSHGSAGTGPASSSRSVAPARGAVRGGGYVAGGPAFARGGYVRDGYGHVVGPVHFFRPYYAFRPRVSVGFGIWAGYPFAYSLGFYDPFSYYPYGYAYPYPYPYSYPSPNPSNIDPGYSAPAPYPPAGSGDPSSSSPSADSDPPADQAAVADQLGQQNMGGLSFDVQPSTAQVLVDGRPAGRVAQFTPTTQPMGLPAGPHQVEIRAPGYHSLNFDVDIIAGEVIPYQGALQQ